ncbi:hypothetical protein CP533_4940 [Ophiocordyceps camponoti-saundersi (nom. inval.)]|nr:hypothetical protein CP533_4940 [Ophiocordyceps camponoti-saundersi (nom. inval.)]
MAGFRGPHDDDMRGPFHWWLVLFVPDYESMPHKLDLMRCQSWIVVFSLPDAGLPERPGLGSLTQPRVAQLLDVRPPAVAADVLASSFLL